MKIKSRALEKEMGLDRPLFVRYLDWIGGLLRGKMGKSIKYNMPVDRAFLKAAFSGDPVF